MQKSKHKLESKQKFNCQNNKETIDTNYETIETQFDQQLYSMKNVQCSDLQMSPQKDIMASLQEEKTNRQNDAVHLEIELDDGKIEFIKPNANDDPYLLARNFCHNNQLDQQMVPILAQNILKTIEKLIKTNSSAQFNQSRGLKNGQSKSSKIKTEPAINNQIQNKLTQNLQNQKSPSNHFQSISKQFLKKKKSHQNLMDNKKNNYSINANKKSNEINEISKSILNKKIQNKSYKKQPQYYFIKTQKSLKTQPNQTSTNKVSPFISINKQNQNQQSFFDYLPQNSRKRNEKKTQNLQGFMRRNCCFQPDTKNSQKNINSSQGKRKSGSKDSLKKTFTRSIDHSLDSQKNHSNFNRNHRSPLVNYSLANLSTNSSQGMSKYHRKQVSNSSIIQNSPISSKHAIQTHIMYENQKQKAFKSIFSLLDDDLDGAISIVNINLVEKIQQRLIQVLFPVLQEMQILETQLNEKQFIEAMEKLFIKLSVDEKGYILKYFNKQQQEENNKLNNPLNHNKVNFSFIQPKMLPISMNLVNQTQRRNVDVYEYSKIREQMKNKKLEKQRIQKQKSMMKNCTFHPKVNSKKIIYF